MSKNSNRPNNSRNEFPVFAGILLGIVMGLGLAGGIAWFILKKNPIPVPLPREAPIVAKPAIPPEAVTTDKTAKVVSPTGAGDSKIRFEFYKELTEKSDTTTGKKTERHASAPTKPAPVVKPAENSAVYFLQEGAYTNTSDAEKIKAKLALIGMQANVQQANIPDKGIWYRVRLGPYKNSEEMNEALAILKLNGLNAAPIRAK